jgi:hypothetical protein
MVNTSNPHQILFLSITQKHLIEEVIVIVLSFQFDV